MQKKGLFLMRRFLFALCLISMLLMSGCGLIAGQSDTSTETPNAQTPNAQTPNVQTPEVQEPEVSGTPAEASTLNGIPLENFTIVYSVEEVDYNKRAAEYIKTEIYERTGISLNVVGDHVTPASNYEIVVGETNREISTRLEAHTVQSEFAILAEETSIAIEGDYFVVAAAAFFFIETYVPMDNFAAEIPTEVTIHNPITRTAKNYILLIGDGMGLYQTLIFDFMKNGLEYSDGEDIFYGYYLPYSGYARTWSLSGTTDSAAGGTALATGYKTTNGYIGQDKNHNPLLSTTELAGSLGMSTAVMSTEKSKGATPSSFSAHADDRYLSDEILEDQAALTELYGTIINCYYDNYTAVGIEAIENHITDTLDKLDDNEKGFFLMYEEAYIDKHCHSNDLEMLFQAVVRFNQAIARFMEYAFYNPETCVIITADHETGALLPSSSGGFKFNQTSHSSYYVPVFAFGDGTSVFDGITMENVQIPITMTELVFGVEDFGDRSQFQSLLNIDPNFKPTHEHTFVNGECKCGEIDPDYIPPHTHTFVDGVCECGKEYTDLITYVLDAATHLTLMDAGTKSDGENEIVGTYGFFTLHYSEKTKIDVATSAKTFSDGYYGEQRISMSDKTSVGDTVKNAIQFTTDDASTVNIWWVGGADGREIEIFDANGNVVYTTAEACVKYGVYLSTIQLPEGGTYYIGCSAGSNYYYKVEVTVG